MKDNCKNYFVIERLDNEGETDNLKNIYDLSILNRIKEVNFSKKNKNKIKSVKKISQYQKEKIIQVIKKVILSANLTYKWKMETFKQCLLIMHLFIFISAIASNLKDPINFSLISIYFSRKISNIKTEYNITYNLNETINNFTNDTERNWTNASNYNSTNALDPKKVKMFIFTLTLFNQIILIPVWLIFLYRYIPKWKKVNDIIYKITNHLLYCESFHKSRYYYQLMKNYSILVVKKRYFSKYKELPEELKTQNILPINWIQNKRKVEKNIFLYCINIINDFVLEDFAIINYHKLISNEDSIDINILIKYLENCLHEKIKKYTKRILMPMSILIFISLYKNQNRNIIYFFSTIFILINFIIGKYIFKEYYKSYKKNIDKFIDNFNSILIQKNRFIYRKNRLIMYFALKSNEYTKNEIINCIKKIIS